MVAVPSPFFTLFDFWLNCPTRAKPSLYEEAYEALTDISWASQEMKLYRESNSNFSEIVGTPVNGCAVGRDVGDDVVGFVFGVCVRIAKVGCCVGILVGRELVG